MTNPPAEIAVDSLHLPGREGRMQEAPYRRMGPLADEVARAIVDSGRPPDVFFGYSMGAILAFEVSRRLRDTRMVPRLVIVGACRAPHLPRKAGWSRTYDRTDAELIAELRELEGTPEDVLVNEEVMRVVLPRIRADLEVIETYEYKSDEPLECPVVTLAGADDPRASPEDLRAWAHQTTGELHSHVLPGRHFFLLESWEDILERILPHLIQCSPSGCLPQGVTKV